MRDDAIPETVPIPGGDLTPPALTDEGRIRIAPFEFGRTPITNRGYSAFLAAGRVPEPPWWKHPDFCRPLQPVVGISWYEATAYCGWLSERTGRRWRLPDQAEWEFAIRGGFPAAATAWGDEIPPGEIPDGPLAGPWDVGQGTPNGYGVLDPGTMVHEWCRDWQDHAASENPPPRSPRRRASRGGSWRHRIRWSPPGARSSLPPDYRYSDYGSRVLEEIDS